MEDLQFQLIALNGNLYRKYHLEEVQKEFFRAMNLLQLTPQGLLNRIMDGSVVLFREPLFKVVKPLSVKEASEILNRLSKMGNNVNEILKHPAINESS